MSSLRWSASGVLPGAIRAFRFSVLAVTGAALAGVASFVWVAGSANPFTPAGYVGYLTRGAVIGQATFHGTQRGPSSPERKWLLAVTNVSLTPYTYAETSSTPRVQR